LTLVKHVLEWNLVVAKREPGDSGKRLIERWRMNRTTVGRTGGLRRQAFVYKTTNTLLAALLQILPRLKCAGGTLEKEILGSE